MGIISHIYLSNYLALASVPMEIIMETQVAITAAIFNCSFAFHLLCMITDIGHKGSENGAEILK